MYCVDHVSACINLLIIDIYRNLQGNYEAVLRDQTSDIQKIYVRNSLTQINFLCYLYYVLKHKIQHLKVQ